MKRIPVRMLILLLALAAVTAWHYVFTRPYAPAPPQATEQTPAPVPPEPPQPQPERTPEDQPRN